MLWVTSENIKELVDHSKEGAPNEVCGILAGTSGTKREVTKIYQMANADESAESFLMDPGEQLKVMKDVRNLDLEMVGIYHSHPATRAYPSEHDVRMAFYPDASYVIISLKDADHPEVKSFNIKNGNITEEELGII